MDLSTLNNLDGTRAITTVTLSRTNLEGLLSQLDDNARDAQIMRKTGLGLLIVHAGEDDDHYGDRPKGDSFGLYGGRDK